MRLASLLVLVLLTACPGGDPPGPGSGGQPAPGGSGGNGGGGGGGDGGDGGDGGGGAGGSGGEAGSGTGGHGGETCTPAGPEVCNGLDDDCSGAADEPFLVSCEPCADRAPGCTEVTVGGGALRYGTARNLVTGNDRGVALPPLPRRSDFIYIANSDEDTVSKVRVADGLEVARFLVGDNPSRTAVDGNGDAWVAMRGVVGDYPNRPKDGVVKIDGSCTPAILPPAATRECLLLDIKNVGKLLRGVAIDGRGDAWVGAYIDGEVIQLDGRTGRILQRVKLVPTASPYGLAIDPDGNPWVASRDGDATILRIDPVAGEVDLYLTDQDTGGYWPYGIAVDGDGDVWFGTYAGRILKVDGETGDASWWNVGSTTRGVAVDEDGVLWVADSGVSKLHRVDRATGAVLDSVKVGPGPVGVAVDHDGFIWSANQSGNSITKVKPGGEVVDTYSVGRGPYTYSDMTGSAFRIFRRMKGRFTATYDIGAEGARWTEVVRSAQLPPPSTLSLRLRAADTEAALLLADWKDVTFEGEGASIDLRGRLVQLEAVLATDDRFAVPSLAALRFRTER